MYENDRKKNLEKNNGPRRNIVADYHRCNLIILLFENKSHKILFTNRRFWLVRLVGRKMVVGILDSFYVVFAPLLAPIPNFIQTGQKTKGVHEESGSEAAMHSLFRLLVLVVLGHPGVDHLRPVGNNLSDKSLLSEFR